MRHFFFWILGFLFTDCFTRCKGYTQCSDSRFNESYPKLNNACEFTFTKDEGYIKTEGKFTNWGPYQLPERYKSFALIFKITPKGEKQNNSQPVFALYDKQTRKGTPQILFQVQPFRLFIWGHPVMDRVNKTTELPGKLQPNKTSEVKLIFIPRNDDRHPYLNAGIDLVVDGIDSDVKDMIIDCKTERREPPLSKPYFIFGGQENDKVTISKGETLEFPYSPLEATINIEKYWATIGEDVTWSSATQLAKAATLLDDCNLGKDPGYGNQGWVWHSISRDGKKYVEHRNCPGGHGTTTTTAPTTIPPSTTTGPSTEPPTTTIPPPTTIPPTEYVPMIEDNHFPIAEETQTDEFLEGESENTGDGEEVVGSMSPVKCGAGCITGVVVCLVLMIVLVVLICVYHRRNVDPGRNKNQNRRRGKSKALYRALEAPNLIEEVTNEEP